MSAWLFYRVVAWVNRHDPDLAFFLLTGERTGHLAHRGVYTRRRRRG